MKQTTKMSRAVGQLEKMYNVLNLDKFGGALPVPVITVQSKPGTYGHCSRARIWQRKGEATYEMNIAAEQLNAPIEEVIDTLLHEMVHLYCRENEIQEVSRGGKYHNKKFKELAEKVGLKCVEAGIYGWNTEGAGNDGLIEYALEKGWSEIMLNRESERTRTRIPGAGAAHNGAPVNEGKRPSSTRKLQCPCCGNSVRATKTVNIICGDCMKKMIEV